MQLDYGEIGRRIRAKRKELGYTQEYLAECTELSIVHISHIETANTKVSLPALVNIANALQTTPDALLCDNLPAAAGSFRAEIAQVVEDCTTWELQVLTDSLIAIKESLRKRKP